MGMLKEFKEFAMRGNIVDLAIAVIIGGAFGKIVTAFTESIVMPIIALIVGKGGMSGLTLTIGSTVFPVGVLLQAVIDFLLIAFVLFMMIKALNSFKKKEAETPAQPPSPSTSEKLLMEIRDELKNKK